MRTGKKTLVRTGKKTLVRTGKKRFSQMIMSNNLADYHEQRVQISDKYFFLICSKSTK